MSLRARPLLASPALRSLLLSLVAVGVALSACGEDETAGPRDTSGDADGGRDSATSGSGDGAATGDGATGDSSATDGATDGTVDSTVDSAADGATDGAGGDAKTDATADAGCAAPVVPGLKITDVSTSGFGAAYFAAQPPGSNDWYVVRQSGVVTIVRLGVPLATPFIDLSAAFGTGPGERGLLSIAFHPSYASNGRFFLMGTPATGADGTFSAENADAVVEYQRDGSNADIASPTKVRDIVVLPASAANHNGGTAMFGPGGFLYVATGDGGGGCESNQSGAVQDVGKIFGKILRLDVNATAPFAAAGNPFAATGDARVYHYGLRNPFRFSFDTNDLYIGDVGQGSYEEISFVAGNGAGKNFGWPAFEGSVGGTCGTKPLGGPAAHTPPIVTVDRRPTSTSPFADYQAIVGGRVYRGTAIPALQGVYLFADFYGKHLGAVRVCAGGQVSPPTAVDLTTIPTPGGTLANVSSFAQGNDGELYVTYGGSTHLGKFVLK